MPDITITHTLSEDQKLQAARLFFDAFGQKFIHLLGLPDDAARSSHLLYEAIRYEYGHYALQGDRVLGGIGLVTGKAHFGHFPFRILRKHFPFFGAAVRAVGYWIFGVFDPSPKADELLIDVLFVDAESRGLGIGSQLLSYAEAYARQLGKTKLILGVINTNHGAKRLYERMGFVAYKYERTGFFTAAAGFTGSYMMRKKLE